MKKTCGSSARFGYDSAGIDEAFPDYDVVNMGVFAYTNALPQLEIIRSCMGAGDILLHSPEFDAAQRQFCTGNNLDAPFWSMAEGNYDAVAMLDLRNYGQIFTPFHDYLVSKEGMEPRSWELSPADFDEDGNPAVSPSYNEYGDYILYRPNADDDAPVYGLPVRYVPEAVPTKQFIEPLNRVYETFLEQGVRVYFTYAPRNRLAVSEDSTPEARAALDAHLREELCVPVISEIEDSLVSGVYLYGTDNHLSTEGVALRTERIIAELRAQLERELPGLSVVNFGMYAALGTTVMLDLSEDRIRPGDIVILIPEQQAQTLSGYFDASVMWQGLDGRFSLLKDLPPEKWGKLLGQLPAFAGQKFSCVLHGTPPEPQGVYARTSFNDHGDVDSPLCKGNVMPGGFDANTPILFEEAVLSEAFVERVNDYAETVRQRGGELWYAFGPMNLQAVSGDAAAEDFYDTLTSRLTIPVIGNPRDSLLPAEWFYDTNFHLNNSGKQVYTRVLVDAVKAMLGDSSPTEIPVPPMPDMAEEALWQGDDRDCDCFLYEERDGAWSITGLTEQGMDRETLTMPTVRDGMPVRSIGEGAFSAGRSLRTVVIQQNIQTIADGAFADCDALERIVLAQETPSACRVGQGLLTGTNAMIFVPQGTLSDYRTDYFWSLYSLNIREYTVKIPEA